MNDWTQLAGAGLTSDPRSVPILYFTNRAVKDQDKQEFGGGIDTNIHYGYAYVRVPETHHFGQPLNWSPSDDSLANNSDETTVFVIRRKEYLSEQEFAQRIKDSSAKSAIIYVPGFKTGFDESLVIFAQILYDGQLNDFVPVLFSWPTMGSVSDYEHDGETATDSVPALEALIKSLQGDCGVDNINIIAHSMGNRIVVDALADLSSRSEIHA
jgi:esterase/lipase superfamily enzyme